MGCVIFSGMCIDDFFLFDDMDLFKVMVCVMVEKMVVLEDENVVLKVCSFDVDVWIKWLM